MGPVTGLLASAGNGQVPPGQGERALSRPQTPNDFTLTTVPQTLSTSGAIQGMLKTLNQPGEPLAKMARRHSEAAGAPVNRQHPSLLDIQGTSGHGSERQN